jgi:hypothetical protein
MKSNLLNYFLFLIISALFFIASWHYDFQKRIPPTAVKGVLDLTDWDFKRDGPVNLSGQYEFYWQQQLKPMDFSAATPPKITGFIKVPGYWNSYELEGKNLPGNGYATYRLKILINNPKETFALKFLSMGTAFNAYLNEKKICSVGTAEKDRETTTPRYFPG